MSLTSNLAGCFCLLAGLFLTGCEGKQQKAEDKGTYVISMPGGQELRAEVMYHRTDLLRGMKYRDSLPEGRGMLFVHGRSGQYPYWMYEVKVPLDIIWLDKNKNIVQLIHQAPPCPGPPNTCKSYGGQFDALYVLEIRAGSAKRYGLHPGATLKF